MFSEIDADYQTKNTNNLQLREMELFSLVQYFTNTTVLGILSLLASVLEIPGVITKHHRYITFKTTTVTLNTF